MKSNVPPVPKAPTISPSVAALLSVCFTLLPRHHCYCSRPIVRHTAKHFMLTTMHAGVLCLHLRNPILPVVCNPTVSNSDP